MDSSEIWERKIQEFRQEIIKQNKEGRIRWTIQAFVKLTGLPASRLRFWQEELKFNVERTATGNKRLRNYTLRDVELLLEVIRLVEVECYTLKGVKRQLLKSKYSKYISQ